MVVAKPSTEARGTVKELSQFFLLHNFQLKEPMETSGRERSRTPSPPVPEQDQRSPLMAEMPREQQQDHFGAAPGEQVYDAVPIPGAYQPMSPTHTGGFQR